MRGRTHRGARRLGGGVVLAGLVGLLLAAPSGAQTAAEPDMESYPVAAGRDETFGFCTACHGFKLVSAQGMSRERWDTTLTWMTANHGMPKLEGEDRETILAYLAEAFPAKAETGWKSPFAPQ